MSNRVRNARGRFVATKPIDVREESQIPILEAMIASGPVTFILVHADWCGHCQTYKPTWKSFEKTPGRTANIASVHHDMMEKVPTIAKAKIEGYPSVIKVQPSGKIEEYKVPGSNETTNALPEMRDEARMKEELTAPVETDLRLKNTLPKSMTAEGLPKTIPVSSVVESAPKDEGKPGYQGRVYSNAEYAQAGGALGSVMSTFLGAVQQAGPAALLLLANNALSKRSRKGGKRSLTYKSPKRASRRASTRKNRK